MTKLNITVLGDICPRYDETEQFNTGNPNSVFNDILPLIEKSDLVVCNLECPITNNCEKLDKNSINLKSGLQDIKLLAKSGISGYAIANNHILDYGEKGLSDTLKALEKEGLFWYGIHHNRTEKPFFVYEFGDIKIGFIAFAEREFNCAVDYGTGAVLWDDLESPAIITHARLNCDFLILQYHGGIEHYKYPSPYLQKKCRTMANAGADFITCQHSHCIGTREQWNGSEILYGQGNTLFGYKDNNDAWNKGLIACIELIKENETIKFKVKYLPIEATRNGEKLIDIARAERLLEKFNNDSCSLNDSEFIAKQWKEFCKNRKDEYIPMLLSKGRLYNKLNRITGGWLINHMTKKKNRRNTMNLIRCDAHREVVQTLFEQDWYGDR